MERISIPDLAERIPDNYSAYLFLEEMRWPEGPLCPHCGHVGANYIKPREGTARATRTGNPSQRRLWQCKKCRRQFSAMTGTIFHGSKVPLRTWLLVVFEMCASKNGMAAREIQRKYAVAPKTAWFMAHRIREAMRTRAPGALIGTIVADETWIGGDPTNKHGGSAPARARREGVQIKPGEMGTIKTEKTPVLSLIDAETGEVRSRVVANVIGPTLRKVIAEQVNMGRSVLWTDDAAAYGTIGREFLSHSSVNHLQGEYERDGITTNRAEGYFGQLKRSINGTYHHVSEEHLPRYLAEFDFRYSTSDLSDTQRMARLMGQVEDRRISYKRLVW